MNAQYLALLAAAAMSLSASVTAEELQKQTFSINPVVMETDELGEASLGLEYHFKDSFFNSLGSVDAGDAINSETPIGEAAIGYNMRGVVAVSGEKNPRNFQEIQVNAQWLRSTSAGIVKAGGFAAYETDQSFDDKQLRYGINATYGKSDMFSRNDFMGVDLAYGQLKPDGHQAREAVLGANARDKYGRVDAEFLYLYPLKSSLVDTAELNYRYFYELDAPSEIKQHNMDQYDLTTIRFGLKNNLYVAYSEGKLPFDKQDGQVYQLGISYNLK